MLSSMNVTVIPFLLGAFMSVKNQTEWNFGPEYVFELNKTTTVFMKVYITEALTATVQCRPKGSSENVQDLLVCHASRITFSQIIHKGFTPIDKSNRIPDQFFIIKFNTDGVETFNAKDSNRPNLEIIIDIIEQFNIEIDLSIKAGSSMKNYEDKTSGTYTISSFMQKNVDTVRAFQCNSLVIITYTPSNRFHEDEEFFQKSHRRKSDFHLRLLPISYPNPADKTFSIKKYRTECNQSPKYIKFMDKDYHIDNITHYYSEMEIRDTKPKFTSCTHLEGTIFFPQRPQTYKFTEDVHLALLRINFARKELDPTRYVDMRPL